MTQEYTLTLHDGEHHVVVSVDFEKLARILGARAVRRKNGKATVVSGSVVVKEVKPPKSAKT